MASITLTIADVNLNRVLDALSAKWGYSGSGGQTKGQFVKQVLANYAKSAVKEYEAEQAAKTAKAAAEAAAESEISIT